MDLGLDGRTALVTGGGVRQSSYSATKAGLVGFSETLALEGAKHGVIGGVDLFTF
jgi:NAD(P)-dependent dehydrogenase (short-subunit alcohol dehydrogenase family)